jgi:hypothetical protein
MRLEWFKREVFRFCVRRARRELEIADALRLLVVASRTRLFEEERVSLRANMCFEAACNRAAWWAQMAARIRGASGEA